MQSRRECRALNRARNLRPLFITTFWAKKKINRELFRSTSVVEGHRGHFKTNAYKAQITLLRVLDKSVEVMRSPRPRARVEKEGKAEGSIVKDARVQYARRQRGNENNRPEYGACARVEHPKPRSKHFSA